MQGATCPRCKTAITQARLLEPIERIDQELNETLNPPHHQKKPPENIETHLSEPERASTTQGTSPTPSSRSSFLPLRNLPNASIYHNGEGSTENTSLSSSKGKRSLFKSGSSSPKVHISYALFVDAKYLLAYTSQRISRRHCELGSWSEAQSFNKIVMATGSSARYAVISEETHVSVLVAWIDEIFL